MSEYVNEVLMRY